MSIAKKIKQLVKEKPSFGTNPNDPWSAKANISEDGGLTSYLLAKGINPKFVSRDTKISHAKSAEFAKWKKDHQFEEVEYVTEDRWLMAYLKANGINPLFVTREKRIAHAKSSEFAKWKRDHVSSLGEQVSNETVVQNEEVDSKDTITLDIPFMIRVLEYAREDAKDDMALHKVVEKLIEIRNKGTLSMNDYEFVTKIKEEYELTEGKMKDIVTDKEEKSRLSAQERGGADAWYGRKYNNPHELGSTEHKAYHQGYHGGEKNGKDYGTPRGKPIHSFRESALERFRAAADERKKKHDQAEKEMKVRHAQGKEDMKGAIDRLEKSLNKESVDSEHAPATHAAIFHDENGNLSYIVHFHAENDKHAKAKAKTLNVLQRKDGKDDTLNRVERIVKEEVEQIDELNYSTIKSLYDKRRDDYRGNKIGEKKKGKKVSAKNVGTSISRLTGFKPTQNKPEPKNEDVYQDGAAATQTNFDGANSPDNTEPCQPGLNKKREMSKSARIIKSIYKKLGVVKEELYDHEKEDKSVTTYGKKPKLQELDPKRIHDDKPQAAVVMSGGTTLTGQSRDTLEIDPEMKRPNRFDKRK